MLHKPRTPGLSAGTAAEAHTAWAMTVVDTEEGVAELVSVESIIPRLWLCWQLCGPAPVASEVHGVLTVKMQVS